MHMRIYKIAVINLGSTSTKIAYYENENCLFKDNIVHTARALEGFSTIWEQFEFRKQAIEAYLKEKGIGSQHIFYIVHAAAQEEAENIRSMLEKAFPGLETHLMELSPVFVAQGGPKCIAIQYIER